MINNGFMYWIFFSLAEMLYGLIPGLYDAFKFFATYQFFSNKEISTIWGNLYILLSVLVLFAIAIKLINAIVNPDVLTDTKKGVRKAYFSAVIAVFLTILTPYMFSFLVEIQDHLINNQVIDKLFFNSTTEENSGKVVAWTAITSFINLDELEDATKETNHAYVLSGDRNSSGTHTYILSEEVDTGLASIYNAQPWQYPDTVHQNPILMLIAGAFIAYEFILLVMDTALRSIKLGVLQMMTPIVLGAYIFKSDILKNWVLEYIKTFIQVFLLYVAISIMTKVLSVLPNIFAGAQSNLGETPFQNWLLEGIINILAVMALLRLIHQIVPLINKIFGTKIESKGGIRGRLGEMAAIGGIAQRAWDTFRQHPIQTGRRILSAPISAVGGAAAHGVAAGARVRQLWTSGHRGGAILAGIGGALTLGGAAARGARQGWQHGNIRAIGAQGRRYEETHRAGSTLGGRLWDDIRENVGLESRETVMARNAERASKARQALSTAQQHAVQLATSEYSSETVTINGRARNVFQINEMINNLREELASATNNTQRQALRGDIETLQEQARLLTSQATERILNAASNGSNLSEFIDPRYANDIQARGLASAISNGITEQIGVYGANSRFEQVGWEREAGYDQNLVNIEAGTLGTEMQHLLFGDGAHAGVDTILRNNTQFYDEHGDPTARGRASADQKSRDSRYVDNASPNHGGNNGGNNH